MKTLREIIEKNHAASPDGLKVFIPAKALFDAGFESAGGETITDETPAGRNLAITIGELRKKFGLVRKTETVATALAGSSKPTTIGDLKAAKASPTPSSKS